MKSPLKVLLNHSVKALVIGSLFAVSGCGYFAPKPTVRKELEKKADAAQKQLSKINKATLTDSELSGTDDAGNLLWKVSAQKIKASGNPMDAATTGAAPDAHLIDAHATLYNAGKPESQFSAPHIQLLYQDDGSVRLVMTGGVKAVAQGDWTKGRGAVHISTPKAAVNVEERQLWTNHGVRIEQGKGNEKLVVTAKTLLANTALQQADLGGGVTSTTPRGIMKSSDATWNWKTGILQAKGKVRAHDDEIHFTGQYLKADINTHLVTVWGNVTGKSDQGHATAGKIIYNWGSEVLKATGGVTLQNDGTSVRAASLETTSSMQNATASGNVTVQRDDLNITANTAHVTKIGSNSFAVSGDGNVRVKTADGHASASHATWKNGQISASGNVTLSHAGYRLQGNSLQANDSFTKVTLSGDVHGSMPSGGSISASKAVYSNGEITATGGVSARKGNLRLHASRLESSANGKKLELHGNVTLKNGEGTTVSAPQARYNRAKNEVYAWGGVTVRDSSRNLTQHGKTLTADLNLNQAVLTDVSGSGKINILQGKKLF